MMYGKGKVGKELSVFEPRAWMRDPSFLGLDLTLAGVGGRRGVGGWGTQKQKLGRAAQMSVCRVRMLPSAGRERKGSVWSA